MNGLYSFVLVTNLCKLSYFICYLFFIIHLHIPRFKMLIQKIQPEIEKQIVVQGDGVWHNLLKMTY